MGAKGLSGSTLYLIIEEHCPMNIAIGQFLKFFFGQDHDGLFIKITCVFFMQVVLNVSNLFFSGEGVVCHLDELTGALVLSHRLVISSKDYPGEYNDL